MTALRLSRLALTLMIQPLVALCLAAPPAAQEAPVLRDYLASLQIRSILAGISSDVSIDDFATDARGTYSWALVDRIPVLLPVVLVLEAEGGLDDRLLARVIEARLIWAQSRDRGDGPMRVAADLLRRALTLAEGAGLTDRQIAGLLADLAGIEIELGNPGAAAQLLDRARPCAGFACAEDVTSAADIPAESPFYNLARADQDDLARAFLNRHLPGDNAALAQYLAQRAYDLRETHPIEAARYLDLAWLTGREARHGLEAMDFALRANRFARLREIALEMESLGLTTGLTPREALHRQRLDLRAAFRSGDAGASAAYDALADRAIAEFLDPARFPERYDLPDELDRLLRDVMDTANLGAADRLSMAMIEREARRYQWESLWGRRARLVHRDGQSLAAADIVKALREMIDPELRSTRPFELQEAAYARAGGDETRAETLLAGHPEPDFTLPNQGEPLPQGLWAETQPFREAIALRDDGHHEAAAWLLAEQLRYVPTIAAQGEYRSAQWLWQVAYTLAIGGEPGPAFAVMSRAAAIAARLSFADPTGEAGGSLQLLQRDNWRYLLFVDIAWAAATGRPTEALLVVSDY